MVIKYLSDVGITRDKNEDSYTVIEDDKYIFLAVADGMGGHNAGDRASQIAVETSKKIFSKRKESITRKEIDEIELIKLIYKECNDKIHTTSTEIPEYLGMGTTLTMCIINNENSKIYIGNVGDSRCYKIKVLEEEIVRITEDHSLVQEMINNKEISKEEGYTHPKKNIITRALGPDKNVDVDIFCTSLKNKEILLLCTDGLTNHLKDDEIKDIVLNKKEESVNILVEEVNRRGGCDNTTIILLIGNQGVNYE
jgi:protein phosphatase